MSGKRYYINNFSLVNALGSSTEEVSRNLFGPTQTWMTKESGLLHQSEVYVGRVTASLPELIQVPCHFRTRNNQLAQLAYQEISDTVEALKQQLGSKRIGVILGTSTSGIASGEEAMAENFPAGYDYRMQEMSNVAEFIAHISGAEGFLLTISTACSSSAKSYITAAELMEAGVIDAAIVGGIDSLCGMTINGFSALESYSNGICLPSSVNRNGINIGEAAALAVMSHQKSDLEFVAGGESSDAHHMSAPHPEGEGAKAAIRAALTKAGLQPEAIDYINLHGTATPKNDEMEAQAISDIFPPSTPVSSTKAMTGHTLGAAGATEAGLCGLALQQQKLIPHLWDAEQDPKLPELNLVTQAKTSSIQYCLSNSFAFGGNNVSLIFRAVHD